MYPLDISGFPGHQLFEQGFQALKQGVINPYSLLLLIAAPRLEGLGFALAKEQLLLEQQPSLEWQLYRLLEQIHGDETHRIYNAMQQEINSFISAVELFLWQQRIGETLDDTNFNSPL